MSKIFDALRRAENERRRNTSSLDGPLSAPGRKFRRKSGYVAQGSLPDGFMRELGSLRNALEPLFKKPKRTILFASATAREGTTTIAAGFAQFLALQGQQSVLVCELNARTPSFSQVFSVNGDAGITDYFTTDRALSTLVQPAGADHMDILHVGAHDATVIQLHLNDVLPKLIEEALQQYDTVIIDAPPIVTYPETPPMTAFVDGVVVVVQAGRTKRQIVQRSMETIAKFRGNILGVVLNRKKYYIPEFLYRRV